MLGPALVRDECFGKKIVSRFCVLREPRAMHHQCQPILTLSKSGMECGDAMAMFQGTATVGPRSDSLLA